MYRIELMNELFVAAVSLHLILLSDWVPTAKEEFYGWSFVVLICLFILVNLLFVAKNGFNLHLLLKWIKVRWQNKKTEKPTSEN
jgi:hypothetical protein